MDKSKKEFNIDNFEVVTKDDCKRRDIKCNINKTGLWFSKYCLELLDYSEKVNVYFDEENHMMAISRKQENKDGFNFCRKRSTGKIGIIHNSFIRDKAYQLMSRKEAPHKINHYVEGLEQDGVIFFNLHKDKIESIKAKERK